MTTMPSYPTLLRRFPPSKPPITQTIAANVRWEMARQRITAARLGRILGWSRHKVQTRLAGHRMTVTDLLELSITLDVTMASLLAAEVE